MLSFVPCCSQTGQSWGVCPHDRDRRRPRLPDRPGLPARRPRLPGGFVCLLGALRPLRATEHVGLEKGGALDPQNCI